MRSICSSIIIPITFFFALLASCTRYEVPDARHTIEDRRTAKEARYDHLGFPGDDDVITADIVPADDAARAESDQVSFPEHIQDDGESAEIFSVQVFASKSSEDALKFESSIAALFDREVRTDYRAPYYKVRIGRCPTLEEGETLLEEVIARGFTNAWLVRIRF